MKVIGIGFVGIRTERFEAMRHFFADVMDLDVTRAEPDLVEFRMDERITVEVYGPRDDFHSFFGSGAVVGFRVENFDDAYAELAAAGIDFIGAVQHESGISWNHFRGPDGNVYEILGPGQARDDQGHVTSFPTNS